MTVTETTGVPEISYAEVPGSVVAISIFLFTGAWF